jgi:ATP-dependent DNA ligase
VAYASVGLDAVDRPERRSNLLSGADDAWHIKAASAIIDGEIVVPAPDGTTDFSVLQNELKGKSTKIVLVAFDLLYLNRGDCGSCRCMTVRRS